MLQHLLPIACLIIGVLVGGGAVYLWTRQRIELAVQVDRAQRDTDAAALRATLEGRERDLLEAKGDLSAVNNQLREQQDRIGKLERYATQLKEMLANEQRQSGEKLKLLDEAQSKLTDAFSALASDALRNNNQSFLELAKTNLEKYQDAAKGDLDKRQQAIDSLVTPVKKSLEKFDGKLRELETARVGAYEAIKTQVSDLLNLQKSLRDETGNLVKALRTPHVRGRWGEIQLRRVVELAGMVDHCDFCEQQSISADDSYVRPDLTVHLPGMRRIVVDSKAPLVAYLDSLEVSDEETRAAKLKDHARHIRSHLVSLGKRSYFERLDESPEFVVLFLPGEVFFSEALRYDPTLIEFGVDNNVIIATPTTLIALLRAVAYGWRQEQVAENAKQISELAKELYKRCADLGGHFAKLGSNLQRAVESYNRAVGSLELRVLVTARKFAELGAGVSDSQIDEIVPIEVATRSLQAPELLQITEAVDSTPVDPRGLASLLHDMPRDLADDA